MVILGKRNYVGPLAFAHEQRIQDAFRVSAKLPPAPRIRPAGSGSFSAKFMTASGLISLAARLIHAGFPSNKTTIPTTRFVAEVLRRSRVGVTVTRLALIYLVRLCVRSGPADRTKECGRRTFIIALALASKFLEDKAVGVAAWAKISGLEAAELGSLELRVLKALDYNLYVSGESLAAWSALTLNETSCTRLCARLRQPDFRGCAAAVAPCTGCDLCTHGPPCPELYPPPLDYEC